MLEPVSKFAKDFEYFKFLNSDSSNCPLEDPYTLIIASCFNHQYQHYQQLTPTSPQPLIFDTLITCRYTDIAPQLPLHHHHNYHTTTTTTTTPPPPQLPHHYHHNYHTTTTTTTTTPPPPQLPHHHCHNYHTTITTTTTPPPPQLPNHHHHNYHTTITTTSTPPPISSTKGAILQVGGL